VSFFLLVFGLDRRKENDISYVLESMVELEERNGEDVINWKKKIALE